MAPSPMGGPRRSTRSGRAARWGDGARAEPDASRAKLEAHGRRSAAGLDEAWPRRGRLQAAVP
eukprot:10726684-Alexandrium_andersonii.AAC.1